MTFFIPLFQTEDILKIHESKCKNKNKFRPVQISCDSVSKCKSNINSFDVWSTRFKDCHTIYPHTLVRPIGKYKINTVKYLRSFIYELAKNGCTIKLFVGDNPKRALARLALHHASTYACEYCFHKGTSLNLCEKHCNNEKEKLYEHKRVIEEQIQKLQEDEDVEEDAITSLNNIKEGIVKQLKDMNKGRRNIVWPSSTLGGEQRTKQKILDIIDKIENDENLSKDDRKGIVGRSPLLELEYFHFVLDIPTEYMHSTCLGVVKRVVELTFNVNPGNPRKRITTRKLSDPVCFNILIKMIKMPREFPRRARSLDFAVFTATEFRNIILFYFVIVIDCIEPGEKERKLWLLLAYLIRSCILPNKEFQDHTVPQIKIISEQFYVLYEKLFGPGNCTYNTHIVGSHMSDMRHHGPLTFSSAFGFENFYGEMRHSFTPGTVSPLKQIMTKIMLKRSLSTHTCAPSITYSNYETVLECNNLIYTFVLNEYHFYKIIDITEEHVSCHEIEKEIPFFEETPSLHWEHVGVFIEKEQHSNISVIEKKIIQGKLLRVKNYLLTCPINVLEET